MDIEGGEYKWLLKIDEIQLNKFKQIVIEFHGITNNGWNCNYNDKIKCIEKLSKTHYIVHAHGNNYAKVVNKMPDVIELTYVNKNYFKVTPELNTQSLPIINLDFPNNNTLNDIDLNFYPFKNLNLSNNNVLKYPKVIYFCNKTISEADIICSNNWKKINVDYEIKLYDNEMIRHFLLEEYGELYKNIFDYLQDGPIKADFWRICILYKNGGIYSDIDNLPLISLNDFIEKDVNFVTCSSYWKYNFNPNFIISDKENIILKKCIDWYVNKYNNGDKYDYWNWSIMNAFTQTLNLSNYKKEEGLYYLNNMKIQIIKECS